MTNTLPSGPFWQLGDPYGGGGYLAPFPGDPSYAAEQSFGHNLIPCAINLESAYLRYYDGNSYGPWELAAGKEIAFSYLYALISRDRSTDSNLYVLNTRQALDTFTPACETEWSFGSVTTVTPVTLPGARPDPIVGSELNTVLGNETYLSALTYLPEKITRTFSTSGVYSYESFSYLALGANTFVRDNGPGGWYAGEFTGRLWYLCFGLRNAIVPPLRMRQRNDGLSIQGHARLNQRASSGASSEQSGIRLRGSNTYV